MNMGVINTLMAFNAGNRSCIVAIIGVLDYISLITIFGYTLGQEKNSQEQYQNNQGCPGITDLFVHAGNRDTMLRQKSPPQLFYL
jgi:hypothetical protein